MLAGRPSTRMSRSCAPIWANARSRRPILSARVSGETSVAIRGVRVVGDRHVALLGDHDDLFTAIAARPVLPHHRLQDQDHPGRKDEVVIEFLTEIGSDHGGLGWVGADAVAQIEVRHPRLLASRWGG